MTVSLKLNVNAFTENDEIIAPVWHFYRARVLVVVRDVLKASMCLRSSRQKQFLQELMCYRCETGSKLLSMYPPFLTPLMHRRRQRGCQLSNPVFFAGWISASSPPPHFLLRELTPTKSKSGGRRRRRSITDAVEHDDLSTVFEALVVRRERGSTQQECMDEGGSNHDWIAGF